MSADSKDRWRAGNSTGQPTPSTALQSINATPAHRFPTLSPSANSVIRKT